MTLPVEQAVGQQFLLSFEGRQSPPEAFLEILKKQQVGGVVLFRHKNMSSLEELRGLVRHLQSAAAEAGQPPLLIAVDQEGGQLMAVGQTTQFPGNMALGAARSEKLAYRVGAAMGKELSALGVNVDFAPVCDVNSNPRNPVIGTRSFGEDPELVATLGAALIRGLQRSGVAATAKHFPGHGDTSSDSHHGAPVLKRTAKRIRSIELVPFRRAINERVRLIMTAHIVVPALNGYSRECPATLSREILQEILRKKMGFKGLVVSDAMDMHAIGQGSEYIAETIAAVAAGNDLLLFNHELSKVEPAHVNVVQACRRGLLPEQQVQASARRILELKRWIARQAQFPMSVIGCEDHLRLAQEVARRSITLLRDDAGLLPLRVDGQKGIAIALARPEDLTPADTSSYVTPGLAGALRQCGARVDEFSFGINPSPEEIATICSQLNRYETIIVGTINASLYSAQAELVRRVIRQGTRVIAVAFRLPYDLAAYPAATTYLCTYSILQPSMDALAEALLGRMKCQGKLPVTIPRKL
jgi:beta-N-acetylhexosaminidase